MKKQIIALLLTSILSISLISGCSNASNNSDASNGGDKNNGQVSTEQGEINNSDPQNIEDPITGMKFKMPDAWHKASREKGNVFLNAGEFGFEVMFLNSEGANAIKELGKLMEEATASKKDPDHAKQEEISKKIMENSIPVCSLSAEYNGKKDEVSRKDFTSSKQLGEKNNTIYTLFYNEKPDTSKLSDEEKKDFETVHAAMNDIEKTLELSGYKSLDHFKEKVDFKGKTISGKDIDSSIFASHKLTAINIWATWCSPCIKEMPDLQKLQESLPSGVNFIGICTDAKDELDLAKKIIEKSKVTYENIITNDEMDKGFLSYIGALPTTIFVNSKGEIVGEPLMGAPSGKIVETYKKAIEDRLKLVEDGE